MVTICTCYTLPEAQVIQSQLGGSGIEVFLPDEMTVQNYWLWSNAIGGVRVQVREEDAGRATEVLEEARVANQKEAGQTCPNCGARMQESYGFTPYPKVLLALLFSIPLRTKPTWRCPKCGDSVIPR
jgi:predicted RNA-binding Zn-ribbon protein involved in translation (DUF1610 family)